MREILPQEFFNQPTLKVAQNLLGKFLVRRICVNQRNNPRKSARCEAAVMITEVEAYDGFKDKASHASRGKTERNKIMFGESGRFYIYFTYGMHWMLNVVTGPKNYPAAILIRSGVIAKGQELSKTNILHLISDRLLNVRNLKTINGPARLTKFLKIDKKFNNQPANKKIGLWFEDRGINISKTQIVKSKRIGVEYAGKWANKLYRFTLK